MKRPSIRRGNPFGGDWTETKLRILTRYLAAYTKALKHQPFEKVYIDAFAGTGYREARRAQGPSSERNELLYPDLAESGPQGLLEGSVRRALRVAPPFDEYIFIERSPMRARQLEELKAEFPKRAAVISVRTGDANVEIADLCKESWNHRRAVLFLDPYGMQVKWSTIEQIALTKAVDLWVLFPLGMGVHRLLKRSGEIPVEWRACLDSLLGTKDWYERFYRFEGSPTLFDEMEERAVKASSDVIGSYFNDRLRQVFPAVAPKPRVLRNSKNAPLYLLCFAAGNEKGAPIAVRIASHLLEMGGA